MLGIRIGIDTGGTFTDFVIRTEEEFVIAKLPSTPQDPSSAMVQGIGELLRSAPTQPFIIHGTTVATNALLERRGGRIALVTTKGFEDVIFIGRQTRPELYRLMAEPRTNLLPRSRCMGIDERTSASGMVEREPSNEEVQNLIVKLEKAKAQAVSVCLINSYANPHNEKHIAQALRKRGFLVSASWDILPEYREYERVATTTMNTYLMPVMHRYIDQLEEKLKGAEIRIMQSNEGYITLPRVKEEPIKTVLSGPAGGVVAAFNLGMAAGHPNIITLDMGGTSSDVSLVDGRIRRTHETTIGGFPLRTPVIDVHSVGAGGGSIAFMDRGGALRVGPRSAGADPGPACYGHGEMVTVTDANVVLGRLIPEFFLGGRMKIVPEKSREVVERLGRKIHRSLLETASGIVEIANARMEKAIRLMSIERGFDPRDFALFSFGGAGGLHAVECAENMQISAVIIPKNAGVLSALGLLLADSIKDYSESVLDRLDTISAKVLDDRFKALINRSVGDMKEDGFMRSEVMVFPSLDLRYLGQSFEINVPYRKDRGQELPFVEDFRNTHRRLYSYHHEHTPVEIVNIRVKVVGRGEKVMHETFPPGGTSPKNARVGVKKLHHRGKNYDARIFKRDLLAPRNRVEGPAVVCDPESTTFVPPRFSLVVDRYLNLIIRRKG
jgi:N-methylhydantoinase A/oxoprolinase/acetone carboxylase beta subunit